MDRRRNWRKIGIWAGSVLFGLVGLYMALRAGVGIYLGTNAGKATVARQLESMIGLPVEVEEVHLGSTTSSIKFRILDPALAGRPDAEVLSVDSATADVTFSDLLTGHSNPKELALHGVRLTLRLDADGKILTTLPAQTSGSTGGGTIPHVKLEEAEVHVRQEGKPEFVLSHLNLTLAPDGDRLVLSGSAQDANWGQWTATGEINKASKSGWVELGTESGLLATERLRSIPFVPASLWEHIHPEGTSSAKLRLTYDPETDVKYEVTLRPHGATLGVPDADIALGELTGTIRVAGTRVDLSGCKAKVAGGSVSASGYAEFGGKTTEVKVTVKADGLDVHKVPAEWNVPKDFGGQLQGQALIHLKIDENGHVDPSGSVGNGKIVNAKVRGFDADVDLHLRPEGQKLKLNQGQSPNPVPPIGGGPVSRLEKGDDLVPLLMLLTHPRAEVSWSPPTPQPGPLLFSLPAGHARFQPPKQPDPKAPPLGTPTSLDANVTLRDIDVGELLTKLEVKIPTRISGKVMATVAISVPVERAGTAGAYQFRGTVTSPALTVEGLTITDVYVQIDFSNGKATLSALRGKIPQPGDPKAEPGTFKGSASAAIDPPGDITASFVVDRIPPGELLKAVPGLAITVTGVVSGKAEFRAPYRTIDDPKTWTGSAGLMSEQLVIEGRPVTALKFAASVGKGIVTINDASVTIAGIPVSATGTIALTEKYAFSASLKTAQTSIADLRKLAPEIELPAPVEGLLEIDAKVSGTASPLSFKAAGTIRASKLTLARTPANHIEVKWEANEERLTIPSLSADLFGGSVNGSLDYPFDVNKAGKFEVNFKNVDAGAATSLIPDSPVRLTGRVTGKVAGTIAPQKPGESRIGDLRVNLSSDKLTVQGIPADELVGKATIRSGIIEFALQGKSLGGTFDIKGTYPGQKKQPAKGAERGSVMLRGIDLSQLARVLRYEAIASLRGRLDLTFEFEPDLSSGSGRVDLTGIAWGDTIIARELRGVLILENGVLSLRELSGPMAGGQLSVRGRVSLHDPARNLVAIELSRVNAKQLLAPLPGFGDTIEGQMSAIIRLTYNRELRADGTITMHNGSLAGIGVEELRVPFHLATSAGGSAQLTIREASTRAGSGQLQAEATLVWGNALYVEAKIRFSGVPLKTVVPTLGENALVGNGRITGRFDLNGTNVRSAEDLTGTLVASLQGASPNEIPILQRTIPYLNPIGLVRPFDTGDIRGSLSRGVFRVQRLALVSPNAQVFAEGTITTGGRVDLAVVAHTGQIGPNTQALRLFGLRLPAIGPIPLTLITDVSAFLSNRTVRLEITGTTAAPVVRVNTRALLTEEAVRFFLTRYVLPAGAVDVFGASAIGVFTGTSQNK